MPSGPRQQVPVRFREGDVVEAAIASLKDVFPRGSWQVAFARAMVLGAPLVIEEQVRALERARSGTGGGTLDPSPMVAPAPPPAPELSEPRVGSQTVTASELRPETRATVGAAGYSPGVARLLAEA